MKEEEYTNIHSTFNYPRHNQPAYHLYGA